MSINPSEPESAVVPFHRRIRPGSPIAYLLAALFAVLSALLHGALAMLVPDVLPMATFYPAILFATLLGGRGPGIFSMVLGGILGSLNLIPPDIGFATITAEREIALLRYLVASLIVVWGASHYLKLTKRIEDEERMRKLAVEELAHRLKNKVATIQAIVRYRLRDYPKLAADIAGSLSALSATDELILAAQGRGAGIRDILSAELGPYAATRSAVDGPNVVLAPRLAMTMALVFHELSTNSAKYGAFSNDRGVLLVRWQLSGTRLNIEWSESGGPLVSPPSYRGFGMRLLATALMQFDGAVDTLFEPSGLICRMNISVPHDTMLAEQLSNLVAA